MNKAKISMVAAIGRNRELGKDNKLLWNIPDDLGRFRQITKGHPIIMGRKTFESIGRPLPHRTNIVITRDKNYNCHSGLDPESSGSPIKSGMTTCLVTASLEEAIDLAKKAPGGDEIMIIGGGQIFAQALPMTDRIYLTVVDADFDADTFFPEYSQFTKTISREDRESGGYSYSFLVLEK